MPPSERRQDPRTDTQFSLRNLLRLRSLRNRFALAVLGTQEGLVMAGSREDRSAERVAAHAADLLFGRGSELIDRFARRGRALGARVSGLRFEFAGRPLFLAVLEEEAGHAPCDPLLDDMARRVQGILAERAAAA